MCHTNSQRTKRLARPNRRARRQQIPDPKRSLSGERGENEGSRTSRGKICSRDFSTSKNSITPLLQISVQRRRSQIAQITSHTRSARDKQKSGAAIGIWRVSDPAKEIPFFSETRHLRILSALADPHFAVPEFCGAGSMPSRSRTDRNLDRQIPKGRCRILWLWDLEQNS